MKILDNNNNNNPSGREERQKGKVYRSRERVRTRLWDIGGTVLVAVASPQCPVRLHYNYWRVIDQHTTVPWVLPVSSVVSIFLPSLLFSIFFYFAFTICLDLGETEEEQTAHADRFA